MVTAVDIARELGLRAAAGCQARPVAAAARLVARFPYLPSGAQWVEVMSHPSIMDTTKAKDAARVEPEVLGDRVVAIDDRLSADRYESSHP